MSCRRCGSTASGETERASSTVVSDDVACSVVVFWGDDIADGDVWGAFWIDGAAGSASTSGLRSPLPVLAEVVAHDLAALTRHQVLFRPHQLGRTGRRGSGVGAGGRAFLHELLVLVAATRATAAAGAGLERHLH